MVAAGWAGRPEAGPICRQRPLREATGRSAPSQGGTGGQSQAAAAAGTRGSTAAPRSEVRGPRSQQAPELQRAGSRK